MLVSTFCTAKTAKELFPMQYLILHTNPDLKVQCVKFFFIDVYSFYLLKALYTTHKYCIGIFLRKPRRDNPAACRCLFLGSKLVS